ncbi:hypothetical protein ABZP36_026560 [Zizania latifolia]
MQEQQQPESGRRLAQQFASVDLRRPKGYAAAPTPLPTVAVPAATVVAGEGDPCPRCESRDTKFCYYNNYNTSQPRHFCKGCRRYWTKGGTLRNVPVGGGTRKKSASASSSSSSSAASAKRQKPSKKRRVPPSEPATYVVTADATAGSAKMTEPPTEKTTTTPPGEATSEITTELVVPAVDDDALTDLLQPDAAAVALGLGFTDFPATVKGLSDFDLHFEWPPAFDTSAYWTPGVAFADSDPAAVFLNLP